MISVPDMAILGAFALIIFGPEQLPKVARKIGHAMRDVQNTSQAFIREMERAADDHAPPNYTPPPYETGEHISAESSYEYTPPHYEEPAPPLPEEPFHEEVSLRPAGPSEGKSPSGTP